MTRAAEDWVQLELIVTGSKQQVAKISEGLGKIVRGLGGRTVSTDLSIVAHHERMHSLVEFTSAKAETFFWMVPRVVDTTGKDLTVVVQHPRPE